MSQIITPADLANVMPSLIAEIRHTMEFATPMAGMVRTYRLPPGTGNQLRVSQRGRLSAQHLLAGVDMAAPQKDAISQIAFTAAEAGAQVLVTDEDVRRAQDDVMRAYGRELGDAIGRLVDIDLLATGAATSSAELGPGTGTLFGGASYDLVTMLRKINAHLLRPTVAVNPTLGIIESATAPWYWVVHPYHWFDLSATFTPSTNVWPLQGDSAQATALRDYFISKMMNVNIVQDPNMPLTSPGASQSAVGFFFAKEGLVLVREKDMSIEPERDASARGTELNAVIAYGCGRYSDAWVRKTTAKCSSIT